MREEIRAKLEAAGVNVNEGVERFMGKEELFEKFLKRFPGDPNMAKLQAAAESGDKEAALTAAHTLKGTCGNLSMTVLFDLLAKQVSLFREGQWEAGTGMMPKITAAYEQAAAVIQEL